jgi:predicted lactoylglutathione lyase
MEYDFWLNLPSKDLAKAKEFFVKLGFKMNERRSAPHMVSMFVGKKNIVVNLFAENMFQGFIGGQKITDAGQSNEVLFSVGAGSSAEVDEVARKAVEAGGTLYGKPGWKDGWMYGCGFADLDGHRWNVLYMDIGKMPTAVG